MHNWNASDYNKNSEAQMKWAMELIEKLNITGNESVLDIGCGDGKITAKIWNELPNGKILGIDNSEDMINFARNSFPSKKYPKLHFERKDIRELNIIDEFDIVFSNACLHWVKDHSILLKNIQKSLKPQGRILLQMGGEGNAHEIIKTIEEMMKDKKWQNYFEDFEFPYGFYGINQYKLWLKEAGFIVKRIELIPKDMIQNGKECLAGWIRTTWLPYIERVPIEQREDFILTLVEKYCKKVPLDINGIVHVKMVRLEVEASI